MSRTDKHKDFYRLRKLGEEFGRLFKQSLKTEGGDARPYNATQEYAGAELLYEAIWNKYGRKSMVSNRRRRVSTRTSNAKFQRLLAKIERTRDKRRAVAMIQDALTEERE